ncbi:hypothetical protein ACLKA6_008542 [Drosophila palustris]
MANRKLGTRQEKSAVSMGPTLTARLMDFLCECCCQLPWLGRHIDAIQRCCLSSSSSSSSSCCLCHGDGKGGIAADIVVVEMPLQDIR